MASGKEALALDPTHGTLRPVAAAANVDIMIVLCVALAFFGGPLVLLMRRSRRSRRLDRGEINDALDVAAGWRHMQGG